MNQNNNNGFTLIELMLSMSFIAVLLVMIAMTTIQISNIYTKGITLREVNQAGRTVSDELQRSIGASAPFDATPQSASAPDAKYVVRQNQGGRLCVGQYSYVWNLGKALAPGGSVYNKYSDDNKALVHFAKVSDPGGNLCAHPDTQPKKADATDLLTSGDRDLVVHVFSITQTKKDDVTSQALYAISMVIGTNDQEQLTTNDQSCQPPSDGVGDEAYCSVNQFDIIARAGNQAEEQ